MGLRVKAANHAAFRGSLWCGARPVGEEAPPRSARSTIVGPDTAAATRRVWLWKLTRGAHALAKSTVTMAPIDKGGDALYPIWNNKPEFNG